MLHTAKQRSVAHKHTHICIFLTQKANKNKNKKQRRCVIVAGSRLGDMLYAYVFIKNHREVYNSPIRSIYGPLLLRMFLIYLFNVSLKDI